MTTPTHQPSETDNFCSSKHPHEPAIKPQLDAEGRCLICGFLCQIDQLSQQLAEAREKWSYFEQAFEFRSKEFRESQAELATAIAERDSERRKLSSLKLKILKNHVAAICKCGGELTAVGCAHCNLREAVVLATDICNSKLFDENREAVESILEKSIKYKEHLDATTL